MRRVNGHDRVVRWRTAFAASLAMLCCACATPASEPHQANDPQQQAAVQTAIDKLRNLDKTVQDVGVVSVEPRTWSDSSLGCPQPGSAYLQVITHGYLVTLRAGGKTHEVRVSGENAVMCPLAAGGAPRIAAPRPRVTNLKEMEDAAVADLAQHLSLAPTSIRVVERIPQSWKDAQLGCGGDAPASAAPVSGFRLLLRAKERIYTYHTDMQRVIACPSIEAQ